MFLTRMDNLAESIASILSPVNSRTGKLLNHSTQQACHHPARDITIVTLASGVGSLGSAVVAMALHTSPFAALTTGGATFMAILTAGMNVLKHVKRDS